MEQNYVTHLDELPAPADKIAALEAALTAELAEDDSNLPTAILANACSGSGSARTLRTRSCRPALAGMTGDCE